MSSTGTTTPPALSRDEILRYARHLVLPEVGEAGQRRLKAARVLLVGAGGLGSPAGLYLAAAGVGTLGIVDDDQVDATNLQRQIMHGTSSIGRSKLESAAERLHDINPHVVIEHHPLRLTSANALDVIRGYDIVIDGTDNFPTRYLINDACVLTGKPDVYGAILKWEGQVALFATEGGPCYRCLFREPPPPGLVPTCAEGGVFGVLPGIIGSLQAVETIKWILGVGQGLAGRLVIFDALELSFRELHLARDPACPVCGDHPTVTQLIDYDVFCGVAPGAPSAPSGGGSNSIEITPTALASELDRAKPPVLVDVRDMWEWDAGNLEARGAVHIPLAELLDRTDELPEGREIVAYCRTGNRSLDAAERLRGAGYAARSLRGGLAEWKRDVDPSMTVA
jgi:molybdopterin/thiamine biosynthesis adenylyltransferase/rhodanese-related sulfurtransferase